MKRKLFFISLLLVFTTLSFAQKHKNNAVFSLIGYGTNDSIINSGVGFFIDSLGTAVSDINIFRGARKVVIKTVENKKYNVKEITGYDQATGIIRFNLHTSKEDWFEYIKPEYKNAKEGHIVKIRDITLNDLNNKNIDGTILNVKFFIKYGNAITIRTSKNEKINTGAPVLNESGNAIGIIINNILAKDIDNNTHFAIDINRLNKLDGTLANNFIFNNEKNFQQTFYDYYLKAISFIQQRKWDEALENINKSLELNFENPEAHTRRGEINMNIRQHKESIKDYTNVLRFHQTDDNAFYNIALNYFRMEMFNETFDYCTRTLEYNKNHKEAYCLQGETLFELGNLSEAIAQFDKAIKIDAEYGYAYYQRGVCKVFIGHKEDACSDLKNALKYNIIEANDLHNQMCNEEK